MHELYLERDSLVHQANARVKIILTLVFILAVSLTPMRAWPAYILFLSLTLSAAQLSRVEWAIVFRRALVALPFALAAAPLVFTGAGPFQSFEVCGYILFQYNPAGLVRFTSILIKIWLSIQAAILLNATTSFTDLTDGLDQIGIPDIFVAIFALMWRYLFVIVQEAERMMQARASRSSRLPGSPCGGNTIIWQASVVGRMMGSLFLRSLERSDRVYAAMQARGYDGHQPARTASRFTGSEIMLMAGITALMGMIIFIGILTGVA